MEKLESLGADVEVTAAAPRRRPATYEATLTRQTLTPTTRPSSRRGAFSRPQACAVTASSVHPGSKSAGGDRLAARPQTAPEPRPAAQKTRLLETISALGCVQLDTISVVSRSHETVLWSRLGPYDPTLLGELHYPDGLLTEYWAHAAAIIPVESFPYFREAMDAYRAKYERHAWVESNREVISGVLERIRENGATASRHFERPDGPRPEAWTWYGGKPARQALDHLWSCGDIMVTRRESGFQRVYDLTERTIPAEWLSLRPSAEERQRYFSTKALRALGVTTARWAADYFRDWARPYSTAKASAAGLKVLQDEGLAIPVTVEGLTEPAWLDASH